MTDETPPTILVSTDERGVATVTLNRPEIHNAFDDGVIRDLTGILFALEADPAVKVVVLAAAGPSFSAGADLAWMRRMAGYTEEQNVGDAIALARLLASLDTFAKPTVARVQGAAFAGGLGLISCCDVAVGAEGAIFCVSEVKLGLVPATISPYLIAAIGARAARRYCLSAERFSAAEAHRLGLLHEVVPAAQLDAALERIVASLLEGALGAQTHTKQLIASVKDRPVTDTLMLYTAQAIADARASGDGKEGVAAFFEKRKPGWRH